MRNRRKLAIVSGGTPGNSRNNQSQNTLDPEMAQEYISQVFEEIEGKVFRKLSKEFSRTKSRIPDALSKLDEFLLNSQVRTCSVAVPGTSWNSNSGNRKPNGDRSRNDPCPEAMVSSRHSGTLKGSELEEYSHMVTGDPEEIRYRPHKATGIREEFPYCSPGSSPRKQKKARSTC